MGSFNIPASMDLDIVQSPLGYTSWFSIFAFGVVCDMQDLFQIPCQISVLFSSGQTHSFIWAPYVPDHGMLLI
jgi:hypothetical protein